MAEKPRAGMLTPIWNAERVSARKVFETRSPFFALPAPGRMPKTPRGRVDVPQGSMRPRAHAVLPAVSFRVNVPGIPGTRPWRRPIRGRPRTGRLPIRARTGMMRTGTVRT